MFGSGKAGMGEMLRLSREEASEQRVRAEKAEADLAHVRDLNWEARGEVGRLTQQLSQVREEVERAVLECAEGTVTGAEKAQKRLEAILDSSSSVSAGGESSGVEKLLDPDGPILLELRETLGEEVAAIGWRTEEGDDLHPNDPAVERFGNAVSDHMQDVLTRHLGTANPGDVEERGEEEGCGAFLGEGDFEWKIGEGTATLTVICDGGTGPEVEAVLTCDSRRLADLISGANWALEKVGGRLTQQSSTTGNSLSRDERADLLQWAESLAAHADLMAGRCEEANKPEFHLGWAEAARVYKAFIHKLKHPTTQPKDTHLSGDGERLEEIADAIAGEDTICFNSQWKDDAAFLRDLATRLSPEGRCTCHLLKHPHHPEHCREVIEANRAGRKEAAVLSPENSSGVEEAAQKLLNLVRAQFPKPPSVEWAQAGNDLDLALCRRRQANVNAASTQPVSPQPDSTTRLSDDGLRERLLVAGVIAMGRAEVELFGAPRLCDSDRTKLLSAAFDAATNQKPQDEEER